MATKLIIEHGTPEGEVPIPPEHLHSVSDSSVSLTAGEENPSIIGERDSKYLLDSEGHHRYLRLGRALLYLKEPLHEPVQSKIEKLHKILQKKIQEIQEKQKSKNGGDKKKILNDYLNSKYLNKSDTSNTIYLKNVNIEKWESQPWKTAKAFMPSGQMEKNSNPEDTDIMGILRLISSCKQFDGWLKAGADDIRSGHEKIQEVLKVRNLVAHSHSLCCSEEEMKNGIEQIKILLEHMKQKFESFAEDEDVSEDEKRIYQKAEEKMEDALYSIDKVMTDTDFDEMLKLVVKDICRSRAYESSDETQRKKIAKVQLRYETRRIFTFFYDLYKNRSKDFKERLQNQEALQSFIIEAIPDDVQFLLVALEEKEMFQAENLDALLQLIEPLQIDKDFRRIKRIMMERKKSLERTSAIISATVYDVLILHCEADRNEAIGFRQQLKLEILKDLNPQAKTILYDEYVVSGTSHVSALDYVLEDCRLVFILCTKAFVQNNLSKFQAEIIMYNSLQKNEGPRVIPIYLKEEDFQCSPSWMRVKTPIYIWKESAQMSLMNLLEKGREKYLKSPP